MAGRVYWHAAAESRETTTGTPAITTRVSVTVDEQSGKKYAIFASAVFDLTATTQIIVRLYRSSSLYAQRVWMHHPANAPVPLTLIAYHSAGSTGTANYEFTLENSNTGTTVGIRDAHIMVLEMGDNDFGSQTTGSASTTSTTFQDAVTLSFTPSSSGDYLILGSMYAYSNVVNYDGEFRLYDNVNAHAVMGQRIASRNATSSRYGYLGAKKITLGGSQTWKMQYRSVDGSDQVTVAYRTILALRLDDFPDARYIEDLSHVTTTSTSEVDVLSLTLPNRPTCSALLLGGQFLRASPDGTNRRAYSSYRKNGSVPAAYYTEQRDAFLPWAIARKVMQDGAVWKIDLASSDGSAVKSETPWLAALQLDETPSRVSYRGVMP